MLDLPRLQSRRKFPSYRYSPRMCEKHLELLAYLGMIMKSDTILGCVRLFAAILDTYELSCYSYRSLMMYIYDRLRIPLVPLYGGFPVKLRTFIGTAIPFNPQDTPFTLREKSETALAGLIQEHQRIPGSIFWALADRFIKMDAAKKKMKKVEIEPICSRKNSLTQEVNSLIQPLLKTHSS